MADPLRLEAREAAQARDSAKGAPPRASGRVSGRAFGRASAQLTRTGKVLLQRKCACGKETDHGGECDECRERAKLQRRAVPGLGAAKSPAVAPPIVHQALRSPGEPLDLRSRRAFESHFDRDFSQVRLHRGALAAESARSVGAQAYTVGRHIVLGANAATGTPAGERLLAHELAHVVQQSAAAAIPADLEVTDAHGHAEREADRLADAAFAPQAARGPASAPGNLAEAQFAGGPRLQRKLEGAVVGGVAGAIAGLTIGALAFGPIGALVGGLAGAAVGALAGHLLTRGGKDPQEKDNSKTPLARIAELLKTGILHWTISEEEAHAALTILKGLAPLELLDALSKLKSNHSWQKLLDRLSPEDLLEAVRMENAVSPDNGPMTQQDLFTIAVEGRSGNAQNKQTESESELAKPREYRVDSDGLNLIYLKTPIPVAGMFLQDAANAIAQAYADFFGYETPIVRLTAKERNAAYYSSQPSGSAVVTSTYINEKGNAAIAANEAKRKTFAEFLANIAGTSPKIVAAIAYFQRKLDAGLLPYDDPEALWSEALNAQWEPVKSPLTLFNEYFAERKASREAEEKREADQPIPVRPEVAKREEEDFRTADRLYHIWVEKHIDDPKMGTYKPEDIWSTCLLQAEKNRIADLRADYAKNLERRHEEEEDDASRAKYLELMEKVQETILPPTPPPTYVGTGQEVLNEENDPIKVWYQINPSPAEKAIRRRIADEYMEDVRKRRNQPGFAQLNAADDLANWLRAHRDLRLELALTQAHPESVPQVERVEIQTWETAVEIVVGFIPIVGTIVGAGEVITGTDLSGHPISPAMRAVLAVSLLLPAAGKLAKLGRAGFEAAALSRGLRMSPGESEALFRALSEVAPGKPGAALLTSAREDVLAGKTIGDPKKLEELQQLYTTMGLTDRKTIEALAERPGSVLKGVEEGASQEVKAEVKSLGAMDEASAKKLAADNELREALINSPLAAKLFKKCASPCYPPEMTADMVVFLENHMKRLKTSYAEPDLNAVRDYLYANRGNLNKALADIGAKRDLSTLNKLLKEGTSEANRANFLASGKVTQIRAIDLTQRAYEIGEREGRIFAQTSEGLKPVGFVNPFLYIGSAGQGIDDIMVKGTDVYILEYKGGTSRLSPGQMETDWVLKQIKRLRTEGGAQGQKWADFLTQALDGNRLKGLEISTPLVAGSPGTTVAGKRFTYP